MFPQHRKDFLIIGQLLFIGWAINIELGDVHWHTGVRDDLQITRNFLCASPGRKGMCLNTHTVYQVLCLKQCNDTRVLSCSVGTVQ